ncbi:MAG: DUF3108 domain-containing protein [Kiritimatiellae bacterium]|nr:DUF3108 domain-containing protein [Kiritimatiellia bacterium]
MKTTGLAMAAMAGWLWAAAAAGAPAVVDLPREGMALYPEAPAGVAAGDPLPEYWFPVGEEVEYHVKWMGMTVGIGTSRVGWFEEEDGRRLLEIVVEAESNGLVEMLYPVTEMLRTVVDPYTFLPLSFEKNSHEGHHHRHELTEFDHAGGVARWKSLIKEKGGEFAIGPETRDLMSQMFWIRREPLKEVGETRHYELATDNKPCELFLTAQKKEKIKLPRYGKMECLKVEPEGKFDGLFMRKGRMWVWMRVDERYTIARMDASVPVADIHIVLEEVRGPGDDFWINGKKK